MITSKLLGKQVHDTLRRSPSWFGDGKWALNVTLRLTVFNLTSSKALQCVKPAPKPHLEAIAFEFTQMGKSFLCSSLEDDEKLKYHVWSKYNLEFVPTRWLA